MKIGVLALQGDFARHRQALDRVGVPSVEVRMPAQLDQVGGLIMPGGESTTLTYDSFLNLTERVDGRAIHTQMTYDGKGNMLTRKDAVGTAVERTWTFTYNPTFNFVATVSIPTVGTCGNPNKVVTNTYNGTTGDLTQQQVTGCNGSNPFTFTTTYP